MAVNQIAEQANNTTSIIQPENLTDKEMESIKGQSTVANPENSQILTSEMMESIRGRWWEEVSKWGRYAWDQISAAGRYIMDNAHKITPFIPGRGGTFNWTANHTSNATGNYTQFSGSVTVNAQTRTKRTRARRRR
ncbi:MAG: hypothetical protein PQ975_11935 [Methanobacterium sp.]|jgi:hypothetical protein